MTPVPPSRPEAGRELDALVAEKVMGWTVNRTSDRHWHTVGPTGRERDIQVGGDCCTGDHYDDRAWMPSTDIRAAWEVVEKIRAMRRAANESLAAGLDCETGEPMGDIYDHVAFYLELSPDCTTWEASIFDPPAMYAAGYRASTAPLAICLAALQAVGTPVPGSRTSPDPKETT